MQLFNENLSKKYTTFSFNKLHPYEAKLGSYI